MSAETQPRAVERRKVARQKSFLRGMIYFNNRRNVVDCLVRDISAYGARLIFSDAVTTPDLLDLYIPQKEQTLRVNVVWRHGEEVGVVFPQAAPMDPAGETADPGSSAGPALAERVARLEIEIAGLKRILKKMKTDTGPEFDVA
jgi:PilZ domain-containing protein